MLRIASFGILASRLRRRASQAFAYRAASKTSVPIPARLASLMNEAIRPIFHELDPADCAHLVAVASWLADRGGSDDLVTAGLLHDIGKAVPGLRVGTVDRAANVILRAIWPRGLHWLAARNAPPQIGAGLWVLARHASVGATHLANAGYGQRVQWLVANHERNDLDDPELQLLVRADGASATLPRR